MSYILLTADEVAELTGLTKKRIYELWRQKKLPKVQLGRQVRVPRQKLMEFLGIKEEA